MNAEGVPAALSIIREKLSQSVRQHPTIGFLWAQMEENQGQLAVAAQLFNRVWRSNHSPEAAARCVHCLYRRPQTRTRARIILLHIDKFDAMRPETAMFAATMLAEFGYYQKALGVGYSVTLKKQGDRFIEDRYAGMLIMQCHDKLNLQPETCEKDHVIDVEINGENKCWHLDPPQCEYPLPNCEPVRDTNVLAALLGKKANDKFAFTGSDEADVHEGTIKKIRGKELKLLDEVLDHARIRPQETSMFRAIQADLDIMLKELSKHTRDCQEIVTTYRTNNFPVAWLSHYLGRPLVEAYWLMLQGEIPPLHVFPGVVSLFPVQNAIAASDSPFILDIEAIQLAVRFGLTKILQDHAHRCLICQSTIDALTNASQAARVSAHSDMSISADPLGGAHVRRITEKEKNEYIDHLADCEKFVKALGQKQILGAPAKRELPKEAADVLGQEVVDMIELSRERQLAVLLGDWRLSSFISPGQAVSFRAFLDHAHRQNRLPLGELARALGAMKAVGLAYISVNEELLMAASEILLVYQDSHSYSALFSQLSPAQSDQRASITILANCIRHFSIMAGLTDTDRQQLVAATLTAVFGKKRYPAHLKDLKQRLQAALNLAPLHLKKTLQTIETWDRVQAGLGNAT